MSDSNGKSMRVLRYLTFGLIALAQPSLAFDTSIQETVHRGGMTAPEEARFVMRRCAAFMLFMGNSMPRTTQGEVVKARLDDAAQLFLLSAVLAEEQLGSPRDEAQQTTINSIKVMQRLYAEEATENQARTGHQIVPGTPIDSDNQLCGLSYQKIITSLQ